jgi:hypothetical protein
MLSKFEQFEILILYHVHEGLVKNTSHVIVPLK